MKINRLYIILILLLSGILTIQAAEQSKPATSITKAANAAVRNKLPFNEAQDFDDAQRGFIAPLPNTGVIKDQENRIILDNSKFDFIKANANAPDTVNPSLWRQAQLLKITGLFKVTDHIYQVRGADISNITFIEVPFGIVVIDPLTTYETAKAALDLYFTHRPNNLILAVIHTHSHIDHFGGVRAVASEAQVKSGNIKIIAPEGYTNAAVQENILGGNLQTRRVGYQYGLLLDPGPQGTVGTGLGLTPPTGTATFIEPTDIITEDGQSMDIGGVDFEFILAPDTEAPAEMFIYIPQYKALTTAEDAVHNMHNVYSLRGAKLRDPLVWSQALTKARKKWPDAEVLFAPHHWPIWSNERIMDYLDKQAALYKFINDQTLRLGNQGYPWVQIAEMIDLPESLAQQWYARGYYGTLNHNVKGAFVKHFGWYDGNPSHLYRWPNVESSKKYVEYMGGSAAIIAKAQQSYDQGDYRWVAEVLDHVTYADPSNQQARNLQADALEQLGYQAESGTWRNWFLTGAKELREGVHRLPIFHMASPDMIAAMPLGLFWDFLGMRLNADKAAGKTFVMNLDFSDSNEQYVLTVDNSALIAHPNSQAQAQDADVSLTLTRDALNNIILGKASAADQISSGDIEVKGDQQVFEDFISMLDTFDPWYNIVTPVKDNEVVDIS